MCAADVKTGDIKNKTQEIKVSFDNENRWNETLLHLRDHGRSWIFLSRTLG